MDRKLKLYQLIIYGLPGLPLAMLGLPLFVYLPTYYSENIGLSLSAVGLALLAARSLDVVTDPLIGILNDRFPSHKTHGWRRKSFILAGIPLLLIGLSYLLKPLGNTEYPTEATISVYYLFGWSFVTYLGWTLVNIPWLAWGAEISPNYHEKSALASSREIFAVIGTVVVISIPVVLSIQSDLQQTLAFIANLLIWLIPLTLFLLMWKLSDKQNIASKDDNFFRDNQSPSRIEKSTQIKIQFKAAVSHPAVKKLLPAYFINSFANALPATLFILFVSHVLQLPDKVGVLLMCYFMSAIAGLPLWLYLARKTDKHISWTIALAVSISGFIWVPFLGQGDFLAFLIICLVSGFALGADVVLPASIQADISQDISFKQSEGNSGGLLFGLWGLITKLALALAIGIAFPLLDSVGFSTNISSEAGINTLIILYALVPVTLKAWVIFQMWKYPFSQGIFIDPELGVKNSSTFTKKNIKQSTVCDNHKQKNRGTQNESLKSKNTTVPINNNSHTERL